MPIPAESYPRYSSRFNPCINSQWPGFSFCSDHLDQQVDDLSPGLRGQVVEVGEDPAHFSYLEQGGKS